MLADNPTHTRVRPWVSLKGCGVIGIDSWIPEPSIRGREGNLGTDRKSTRLNSSHFLHDALPIYPTHTRVRPWVSLKGCGVIGIDSWIPEPSIRGREGNLG